MKKRVTALLLCLLVLVQLSCWSTAEAAGDVYFLGAEENILPLSDTTMPFWQNGYLYISPTIFTGSTRQSLEISRASTNGGKTEILYRGGHSIWFEEGVGFGRDTENNTYFPGGVMRNGILFVPASVVASFFDLKYSIIDVEHGSLVWLRQPDFILNDQDFVDPASGSMNRRYEEYLASKRNNSANRPGDTTSPSGGSGAEGKRIYLCMEADDGTAALLDALDRYDAQATFFCTPEFLAENGNLLRRMVGTGQSIGILADAADTERSAAEQLAEANRRLELATSQKTRLVRIENSTEEIMEAVQAEGYCLNTAELEQETYGLGNVTQAAALFQNIENRKGDTAVWLGDGADSVSLAAFLALADAAQQQCLPLRETVTP